MKKRAKFASTWFILSYTVTFHAYTETFLACTFQAYAVTLHTCIFPGIWLNRCHRALIGQHFDILHANTVICKVQLHCKKYGDVKIETCSLQIFCQKISTQTLKKGPLYQGWEFALRSLALLLLSLFSKEWRANRSCRSLQNVRQEQWVDHFRRSLQKSDLSKMSRSLFSLFQTQKQFTLNERAIHSF